MMLTAEEAKRIWCPMARQPHANCIADKCAMWRWSTIEVPPRNAEPGKLVAPIKVRGSTGYCGLAGRPEVV